MEEIANLIAEQNSILCEVARQLERVANQLQRQNKDSKVNQYKSKYGAAVHQEESLRCVN